jgi:antitoxin PrlF
MSSSTKVLEIPATITARGQTTVPAAIRKVLALGKNDQVVFRALSDGTVVIEKRLFQDDEDFVLNAFLDFLAKDMQEHPERLMPLDVERVAYAASLVENVEVDLEASLDDQT